MSVNARTVAGITVVELNGDLTWQTTEETMSRIQTFLQPEVKLVLDMSGVRFMASSGLRMLLKLFGAVSSQSGRLVLVGLSENLTTTLEITGFDFLQQFRDLEAATAELLRAPKGGLPLPITVQTKIKGEVAEVTISGELDFASAEHFRREMQQFAHVEPKPSELVLLVRELKYLSSAGLQVLLLLKQQWLPGVVIRVIQPCDRVLDTLSQAKLITEVVIR